MKKIDTVLCILCDAVDGPSISYWAEGRNVVRGSDGYIKSVELRDGGYEGERKSADWVNVTAAKVRSAARDMREGRVNCCREIQAQFVGNEEDWDYDADGIDCLMQHIVLGDVIYG